MVAPAWSRSLPVTPTHLLLLSANRYRDYFNEAAGQRFEFFDFTESVTNFETFVESVRAIGNDDNPEDVAGGEDKA